MIEKKRKKMVRRSGRRKSKKAIAKRRQAIFRTVLILGVILAIVVVVWAIRRPKGPGKTPVRTPDEGYVTLYFLDGSDMFLIPVQRDINLGKRENIYLRTMKELTLGPWEDSVNLHPSVPDGCNVLSVDINGVTAVVNFNNRTLELLDERTEGVFVDSIVNTLCSSDEIQRVDFIFEGKRVPHPPYGNIDFSGPHTPRDINPSTAPKPAGDIVNAVLYYADKSGQYIVPITTYFENPGPDPRRIIMLTLRRLLNGPRDADKEYLSALFKPGVGIRTAEGVVFQGNNLILALTADDPANVLEVDAEKAFAALRMTFEEFQPFDTFKVLLNDEPVEEFLGLPFTLDDLYAAEHLNRLPRVLIEEIPPEDDGGETPDE